MMATAVALMVGAYLLGGVPTGWLVCRAHGIDLFNFGSGNIGATNVVRAVGAKWGAVVFVADVAKALIPTLIARALFPADQLLWMAGGVAATAGHVFSPFLRFRGGKGVACLLGMVLGVNVVITAWAFGSFLLVVAASRYVSLGSVVGVTVAAVVSLVSRQPVAVSAMFIAVDVLTFVLHRKNIKRLIAGTEAKLGANKASGGPLPGQPNVDSSDPANLEQASAPEEKTPR